MDLVTATVAWLTDPAHWSGGNGIPARLEEHVAVSVVSLLVAAAVSLPLGLATGHTRRFGTLAVNLANLGRALPSLAVIAMAIPLTVLADPVLGGTVYPTVVAMIVLAIPPILVNAYAGVREVDAELVEAARGMGLREMQILAGIEVPLAIPVIAAGLRSAGVQVVATATLGAIFGFGGLGRYLVDGIAQQDDGQIWGGVVLVAGLALLVEACFALLQARLTSPGLRSPAAGRAPAAT
ncbi:MAG TPA: ABC transporter permease [Candidatus Limnocylindrales bacterium]